MTMCDDVVAGKVCDVTLG